MTCQVRASCPCVHRTDHLDGMDVQLPGGLVMTLVILLNCVIAGNGGWLVAVGICTFDMILLGAIDFAVRRRNSKSCRILAKT